MRKEELKQAIQEEKQKRGVTVLAHTYQEPDVIDIADVTGDSFALAQAVQSLSAETVLLCGVRFMAETVKMLSPEKRVLISHKSATCPMAEQIAPQRVAVFKKEHPDYAVCAYINTTAALKAECDVCVTSSSAIKILSRMPDKNILFIPDRNLGGFVKSKLPEKNIVLWDGFCPVHQQVTPADLLPLKETYPGARIAMHPECPKEALALADMVGSTSAIMEYCLQETGDVIIVTERGVADYLNREYPNRRFIQAAPEKLICADMKKTTLQGVYDALTGAGGCEIDLPEPLRLRARKPIDRMLEYGG